MFEVVFLEQKRPYVRLKCSDLSIDSSNGTYVVENSNSIPSSAKNVQKFLLVNSVAMTAQTFWGNLIFSPWQTVANGHLEKLSNASAKKFCFSVSLENGPTEPIGICSPTYICSVFGKIVFKF